MLVVFSTRPLVQAVVWTPFDPVALPLAVKSPYLNVWLPQGNNAQPISNTWPFHWPSTPQHMLGWESIIAVDNVPYWLMGVGEFSGITNIAELNSVAFTNSMTYFNLTAGPVNVQLEWLSPLEVDDLTRLSIPFVYARVTASSADGKPHDVRVGLNFAADLISGDHHLSANASSIVNDDIVALKMQLQTPQPFVEVNDFPEDAAAYIATNNGIGVTYQVSNNSDGFPMGMANLTALPNTVDPTYSSHAPFDNYEIMVNMGNVLEVSPPTVFAIGVVRTPSIKYTDLSGAAQLRYPYFMANFSSDSELISFVLSDFDRSLDSAQAFDSNIMAAAMNISQIYADLLTLTTRQSLSALDVTISQTSDGSWNTSDVKLFMKDMGEVGSGGSVARVNAVSVLYSALPMYLYLAPGLLAHLISPLMEAQGSQLYTQPYAAQHLGVGYPNATAQNVEHNFGIEESANMLILVLAHAQATKDVSLASSSYALLRNWTEYLTVNALAPGQQQTNPLDGISISNQTNLALKGVIGIAAMGTISTLLGQIQDADMYNASYFAISTANSYMQQWLSLSKSADGSRILTAYGDETSTGLLYNLFSDKVLGLNLIPASVRMRTLSRHLILLLRCLSFATDL
ncbi:DUF1793-domain-containing protein [Schizopora paradoxa]|uniref:DUF1793-domain-containing protein n=1 Tax=Schizopora paradoxa TaxID=27342 RepID=A0A0H2R9Q2_9AGAM|nr:DUF1793-domain-containing protein [Schizopora paradoxa]